MARNSSSRDKGVLKGIHIVPADEGGVITHNEVATKRGGQGGGPSYDHDTHTTIHSTMDSLKSHIEEHLKGFFSEGEPRDPKKAEDGGGGEYQ